MGANRVNLFFIIKIAFRNWRKTPLFSVVNLLGLAVGIASCLLIGIYVLNELSYDEYHEKSDRIYRVTQALQNNGENDGRSVSTPFPLKGMIDNELKGTVDA